ncbi:MAG: hypothetical protein GY847_34530 [Proteobacteria bacterium]|nr:hypothetical protein [Pseudomonadota bacterium]
MLTPSDSKVIEQLKFGTASFRAMLCALARRGKAMRLHETERAQILLKAVQTHVVYKGGRILFDLFEIEDMMLDGPLPKQVDGYFEADAVRSLAKSLSELKDTLVSPVPHKHQDNEIHGQEDTTTQNEDVDASSTVSQSISLWNSFVEAGSKYIELAPERPPEQGWPEITSADYLFNDVALGVLRQMSRTAAMMENEEISLKDI